MSWTVSEEWHTRAREALATVARIEALAEQWNSTPDYAPSDYDQGRVDQRHDMTGQLLEALTPAEPTEDA